MKKGDVVRNTWRHPVFKTAATGHLGIVLELPKKDDKHPKVLVHANGTRHWWHMAVVEVVCESR